jgi:hypothetical protein
VKIIFLDIDGVLATNKEFIMNRTKFQTKHPEAKEIRIPYPFNPGCVKIFNEILDETNAIIVLSSDWRFYWDLNDLDKIFKFNGVKKSPVAITSKMKRKMSSELEDDRSFQIKTYVDGELKGDYIRYNRNVLCTHLYYENRNKCYRIK